MAIYKYKCINEQGAVVHGRVDAINEPDLESRLNAMGLELIQYTEISSRSAFTRGKKVSRQDLINFCFHMEQMARAGVPILDSLIDLRDSLENAGFREVISSVVAAIEGGKTLSQALAEFPQIFDQVFVSLIEAGEQSGRLDQVLLKMTVSLKWQDEIAAKTKKLLIYPSIVGTVIVAVIFFLMIYLIPNLVKFIQNMGEDIPLHTRALIATSNFFQNYWYLILTIPIATVFSIKAMAKKNERLQTQLDAMKLKFWLFGPILKKIILARFATYFALLYRSGITVLNCLKINEDIAGNLVIKKALQQIGRLTSDGETMTSSVEKAKLFPPLVIRMLKVGENTGRLDEALDNVSYFYNREVNDAVDKMQTTMEVAMTVILGIVLAWVMISVLGPVYDIISTLKT